MAKLKGQETSAYLWVMIQGILILIVGITIIMLLPRFFSD